MILKMILIIEETRNCYMTVTMICNDREKKRKAKRRIKKGVNRKKEDKKEIEIEIIINYVLSREQPF